MASKILRSSSISNLMWAFSKTPCPIHRHSGSATGGKGNEYAFEINSPVFRFGRGVTRELPLDIEFMGSHRTMVVTDPNIAKLPQFKGLLDNLTRHKINFDVFDQVRIEPSEKSMKSAIDFARQGKFDCFVGFGGGSSMDTAKLASLYSTFPDADFWDFVVNPFGKHRTPPRRALPIICLPTTAGTASECTSIAIFEIEESGVKSGVRKHQIKPHLALVDPENVLTMPREVTIYSGFDVLCHALESYTLKPFYERGPAPWHPMDRPVNQGRNPLSDVWSLKGLKIIADSLVKSVENPGDYEAREKSLLAASMAGMGFGNAGVHLAHGLSYPIAGQVRGHQPKDYITDHPIIPHGLAVILTAAADFEFTGPASPERHLKAAEVLGCEVSRARKEDAGKILGDKIRTIAQGLSVPNGLKAVGFKKEDIPNLTKSALASVSALQLCPREQTEEDIQKLYEDSWTIY